MLPSWNKDKMSKIRPRRSDSSVGSVPFCESEGQGFKP